MVQKVLKICLCILTYITTTTCDPYIYSTTACQTQTVNIQCAIGEVIDVKFANYGRTSNTACVNEHMHNLHCYAVNSINIVSHNCNNRRRCSIPASNEVFGDPCVGTNKYLTIQYKCITDINSTTTTVCHDSIANLQCPVGEVIVVQNANYGRTSDTVCVHVAIHDLHCYAANSTNIVSHNCNNKESCSMKASHLIFGDPCYGTYKYLEIQYKCYPVYLTQVDCENSVLHIECRKGNLINIVDANYQPQKVHVCNNQTISKCLAPVSKQEVVDRCNGKRTCSIAASKAECGGTCVETGKYLSVTYICVMD